MIAIPRGLARSFRTAARKCMSPRSRAPDATVLIQAEAGRLTLTCSLDGTVLVVEHPHPACEPESIAVPMPVLDAVEGAAVELSASGTKGTAQWEGRDGLKTMSFETLEPNERQRVPARPESMHPVSPFFLSALHECGRTAARDGTRYPIHRVQVHGKSGSVIATDSKLALICGRFRFAFRDSVLVPAIPVFGSKELSGETDVRIGRTETHFVVQAGPWMVCLAIDGASRFPDVAGVVPKSLNSTVVGIDERDAEELLAALPEWPDASDGVPAVTLEIEGGVTVRARNEETGEVREIRLSRSTFGGPDIHVALNRLHLARALSFGCLSLRLATGKPVVAEGPDRRLIAATLDAVHVVPPGSPSTAPIVLPSPVPEFSRRTVPLKPEANGHPPSEIANAASEWIDPFAEAEALRTSLADAVARVGRLLQCLKQFNRQRRALQSAFSNLKTLGLGSGGDS